MHLRIWCNVVNLIILKLWQGIFLNFDSEDFYSWQLVLTNNFCCYTSNFKDRGNLITVYFLSLLVPTSRIDNDQKRFGTLWSWRKMKNIRRRHVSHLACSTWHNWQKLSMHFVTWHLHFKCLHYVYHIEQTNFVYIHQHPSKQWFKPKSTFLKMLTNGTCNIYYYILWPVLVKTDLTSKWRIFMTFQQCCPLTWIFS